LPPDKKQTAPLLTGLFAINSICNKYLQSRHSGDVLALVANSGCANRGGISFGSLILLFSRLTPNKKAPNFFEASFIRNS